jgi:transcriptional regulator with XRE-family HTH domain
VGFDEERAVAEHALASYERDDAAELLFPAAAQRIRRAREALSLTQDDVASRWGEQVSMYWDLELFDDEAFTVISVRQLQRLASVLETTVNVLLFGEAPTATLPTAQYRDVVARLEVRMAEDAVSIDQLGDRIGWDLGPLLTDPGALGDLPVAGLWSVCRAAIVDWVGVMNSNQPAS